MQKGTRAYLVASFVGQGSALVRYVILSRILGPEQLGLAALLILTSQFFELITDTASDRFIVQDSGGDSPVMQSVVQSAMIVRGAMIALALIASSQFVANMFDAPELVPSLIGLALTPLILGFEHMDMYRVQRSGNFGPASATMMVGEVAGLVGTAVAAWIVRDHSAVIYGQGLRSLAMVISSHISAKRPYTLGYARIEARRFINFAIPLTLNGLLFFLGSQGDRLLVGALGKEELGKYSAILLLVAAPMNAMSRFMVNIHLPSLSASRDDRAAFYVQMERLAGRTVLLSIAVAAGFTLVGPFVSPVLYGPAFAQAPIIFAFLAVLQTARFMRLWPTTAALALGRSSLAAVDNAARLVALPVAMLAQQYSSSLVSIILGFTFGEFFALTVTQLLASRAAGVPKRSGATRIVLFFASSILTVAWSWTIQMGALWAITPLLIATAITLAAIAAREREPIANLLTIVQTQLANLPRRRKR